jgi:hypothetical protein
MPQSKAAGLRARSNAVDARTANTGRVKVSARQRRTLIEALVPYLLAISQSNIGTLETAHFLALADQIRAVLTALRDVLGPDLHVDHDHIRLALTPATAHGLYKRHTICGLGGSLKNRLTAAVAMPMAMTMA